MKSFTQIVESSHATEDERDLIEARYIKDMQESQEQTKKALDLIDDLTQFKGEIVL